MCRRRQNDGEWFACSINHGLQGQQVQQPYHAQNSTKARRRPYTAATLEHFVSGNQRLDARPKIERSIDSRVAITNNKACQLLNTCEKWPISLGTGIAAEEADFPRHTALPYVVVRPTNTTTPITTTQNRKKPFSSHTASFPQQQTAITALTNDQ